MAGELSTISVKFGYKVESTAGTRPTSDYTYFANIVAIPELSSTPDTIEVTDLSDEWKRYIPGLKDAGNTAGVTANNTEAFRTAWATAVTAAEGLSGGKVMWFVIEHPGWSDAFFFSGMPVDLGIGEQSVGAAEQVTANIVVGSIVGYATKPTTT